MVIGVYCKLNYKYFFETMPTRLIIQQIKSAKLLIDEEKQEFAHTSHSGIVVYCAFLKKTRKTDLPRD